MPRRATPRRRPLGTALVLLLAGCAPAAAPPVVAPRAIPGPDARATAERFERLRHDPVLLRLFLQEMPKGGDIHSHLSGAIYAESYAQWAAEDGLCLVRATMSLAPPPCSDSAGRPPARLILGNPSLHSDVIDAWSLRNWSPARTTGHDQFFDAFGKFGLAARGRTGDMLAEVSRRAAAQGVSYLELMHTVDGGAVAGLARGVALDQDFRAARDRLLAAGLLDTLAQARRSLDSAEARQRQLLGCDTPSADPGCAVPIRYLYQVARARPPAEVFAQVVAGFELTRLDPRVVGLNLVQPEDYPVPMGDFSLHMRMLDALHQLDPSVPVTLHAGELAEGLVPPEGLRFHIRESIETGHARRIGHGVAVIHEDRAGELLALMAARGVLVEVALSSNDVILGVRGSRHPLATFLQAGVPVALVTDDEGVSRSSLTREFQRAVEEHPLGYLDLRAMARHSISHSFAEPELKARLLRDLDQATAWFEARWASSCPLPAHPACGPVRP